MTTIGSFAAQRHNHPLWLWIVERVLSDRPMRKETRFDSSDDDEFVALDSAKAPTIGGRLRSAALRFAGASPAQRRVFLLEDNEANGLVIEGMLDLLGFEEIVWVRSIADVARYRKSIIKGDFAFLIFDISLPDGESFDLLRELKQEGASPICAYTARTSREDYAQFADIGCTHVFEKPLTLDAFRKGCSKVFGPDTAA